MTTWADGDLYGFDLETTGVDVFTDRIVTATVVHVKGGELVGKREWLIDPGIEIPEAAQAVHGISTEYAYEYGVDPRYAVREIAETVRDILRAYVPLVVFNSPFDTTILEAECRRYGVPSVVDLTGDPDLIGVVDPLVLARVIDRVNKRTRTGKYKLSVLCEVNGIVLDNAHNATADALAACQLLAKLVQSEPHIQTYGPKGIHNLQRTAYREEALRRQRRYQESVGRGADPLVVDTAWPLSHQTEEVIA